MSVDVTNHIIVGIGASAGGLRPLEQFFAAVPPDSGCTFVVVQHLSPDFKSLLEEFLGRQTTLPIHRIADGMPAEPNAIYLLPPRHLLTLRQGHFKLSERTATADGGLPINLFFDTLASEAGPSAVGVVLSGGGSDGASGTRAIREQGGLVIVQRPETAEFESMPRHALASANANHILMPEEMPAAILAHFREKKAAAVQPLDRILKRLQQAFGVDFSEYKIATVRRRIQRRCDFRHLTDLGDYDSLLQREPDELRSLYDDLLIGVTEFFREPEAFEALRDKVLTQLLTADRKTKIRIWVAACATGEEAYSFAILLDEAARASGLAGSFFGEVSIFATDIHRAALEFASAGVYAADRLKELSPERLSRYFREESPGYFRVVPEIRKLLVFAPHNLAGDPPFTNLDLVSCRNLLIYFRPALQERAIRTFYLALRDGGCLFLGATERIGRLHGVQFDLIDSRFKLFRKRADRVGFVPRSRLHGISPASLAPRPLPAPAVKAADPINRQLLAAYDHILKQHIPAGLLIDESFTIVHYFAGAARYLRPEEGRAQTGILDRTDGELRLCLSILLPRVLKSGQAATAHNIRVSANGAEELIDVTADPIAAGTGGGLLVHVIFAGQRPSQPETASAPPAGEADAGAELRSRIAALEAELQSTKENLQIAVEELQASNEELQASNEEISASNEELQSTNEEINAVNEELFAVNAEFERKNTELQLLNDDLTNLSNSTDAGTVFVDRDLRIRKFNPAIQRIFPLLPHDVGRPIDHIAYHLDGQTEMLGTVAWVLQHGQLRQKEVRTRDGHWLLQRVLPFRTANGGVDGVVLTFTDIDQTKSLQDQLSLAMDSAGLAWWDWDVSSGHLAVNCGNHCILGFTSELLPTSAEAWKAAVHPDDRAIVDAALERCWNATQSDWSSEHRFRNADGEWRWVRNGGKVVERDAQGRPLRLLGTTQDIHAHRSAEELIHRDAELLSKITEAITVIDRNGIVTYWNAGANKLFGWEAGEMIGRHHTERFPAGAPEARNGARDRVRVALERGELQRELEDFRKDGSRVWTDGRLVRFTDSQGNPAGVIALYLDITERKKAERQRLELEQQLMQAQKMDTIGTLAGGIAHDFNNIIAAILGYTELAMTQSPPDARSKNWHEGVLRAAHRARDLVRRILTFSRFHEPERTSVQLEAVIEDAVKFIRASLPATIQLSLEMGERCPPTLADANQIHQVVLNLATNAAHAMREHGGTLTLRLKTLRFETQRPTAVGVIGAGLYLALEVSDTGHGIPPDVLDKIFDPFFTTKPVGEGTGLGLSIVHGIISGHGGGIDVASTPGVGTTFTLYLPVLGSAADSAGSAATVAAPPRGNGQRVIVIDDEEDVGLIAQQALQSLGYEAAYFSSAADFYAQFSTGSSPPALIVTDQTMPRLTGLDLARKLRADGAGVPIAIVSGFSRDLTPEALSAVAPVEVLPKPFNHQELAEVVHRLVPPPT